jgi:hypothetical protein
MTKQKVVRAKAKGATLQRQTADLSQRISHRASTTLLR